MDVLVELDKKFVEIVTDKLDQRSRDAIIAQEDPTSMSDFEQLKIRKSILHRVYGKKHNVRNKHFTTDSTLLQNLSVTNLNFLFQICIYLT